MVQYVMLENTSRKTGDTRDRLLELAESAVLAKGFSATSIDELIAAAGISKSGFFYHFKDKGELAKGLLLRYLEQDRELLENIFRRGRPAANCTHGTVRDAREYLSQNRRHP